MKYVLILLLVCSPVYADDFRWTSNALIIADWAQTRRIADDPNYIETNPILGENPTSGDVNRYFVSAIILHNVIGEVILPKKLRKKYYIGVSLFQGAAVTHNFSIGVKF